MLTKKPSSASAMAALGTYCVVQEMKEGNWDARVRFILEALLRAGPRPFALIAHLSANPFFRQMLEKWMSWWIPGLFAHYVARKKYIEKRVRSAIEVGCRQLVVMGGGLDTLALRLSEDAPQATVIEVDHPATQQIKNEFLESIETPIPNLTLVVSDLTEHSLSDALSASAFDSALPSVFVAEGLLSTLSEERVREVLRELLSVSATGSKLVLTFMEMSPAAEISFRGARKPFLDVWLKRRSEPFQWGLQLLDTKYFFASCGWKVVSLSRWEDLFGAVQGLPKWIHPPARGEHIVVLEPAI